MAQAMLNRHKKYASVYTQTNQVEDDNKEFCIYMSNNKTFRLYKSKAYKNFVLSFNFGNFKKYIITKSMWVIFRKYINQIDSLLLENNDE